MLVQAFSIDRPQYDPDEPDLPDDRRIVAEVDGEVIGHLGMWRGAQWLGGRQVAMAAVASVAVAANHRRAGVATALLRRALSVARDDGDVISSLFSATSVPYRRAGREIAGVRSRATISTRHLAALPRPTRQRTTRRMTAADLPAAATLHDDVSRPHDGTLVRDETWTRRALSSDDAYAYLVEGDDGAPSGYLLYVHRAGAFGESGFRLRVIEMVAADRDTELLLWHLLASSSSVADTVDFVTRPTEPLLWLLPEIDITPRTSEHWMTRIVDAPRAIAARGWPSDLRVTVPLHIEDPQVDSNDGAAILDVSAAMPR